MIDVLHPYELTSLSNAELWQRSKHWVLHPYELTSLSNRRIPGITEV